MPWLQMLILAGLLQADPDRGSVAVHQELERFQAEYLRIRALAPSEQELAEVLARFPAPKGEGSEASRRFHEKFAYSLLANYKMQKDLHAKHGGRVALSAFGFLVAKDAMADELREWEKQGRWKFPSERTRSDIFEYLLKMTGDGVVEGPKAKEIFTRPLLEPK